MSANQRHRREAIVVTLVVHGLLVVGMLTLPQRLTRLQPKPKQIDIVFFPKNERPKAPVQPPLEKPRQEEPQQLAKAEPPKAVAKPKPVEAAKAEVEPKRPIRSEMLGDSAPVVAQATPEPEPKPKPQPQPQLARTGSFATATAAVAPQPQRSHRTATLAGGFNVVDTPAVPARPARHETRAVTTAGFAAGESDAPLKRNAPPRSPVSVADAGFGDEALPARGGGGTAGGTVQAAGFGDSAAPAKAAAPAPPVEPELDTPVSIVSKAKPLYTDEARELRIEGEVVLEVTFVADGRLTIHGVLAGLGHGLDEAAVAAAKKIKFEPARRDGKAVDHTAKLRVVFRLA